MQRPQILAPLDDAAAAGEQLSALFGKAGGLGASFARKPSSPSAAKMSGMLRPSALTISSSRSMNFLPSFSANARPTVDFPLEAFR